MSFGTYIGAMLKICAPTLGNTCKVPKLPVVLGSWVTVKGSRQWIVNAQIGDVPLSSILTKMHIHLNIDILMLLLN